jgi:FkbH-like protein
LEVDMYSFKDLRKAFKYTIDGKEYRLAILGNCATQFFATAVQGYARIEDINMSVYDADYNQIDAQLLDGHSEVYSYNSDYILLWLATDKLYEEFLDMPITDRSGFASGYIEKIKGYWELVSKYSQAKVLQMNFTEINDKVLGQYSAKVDTTFTYQIRRLNYLLEEAMRENANVYPVDLLSVQIRLGQAEYYDAKFYYSAKMCVSTNALPYVADAVVSVIRSMSGMIKKCIICDLDNTLWGGVIGDDGINNIEIGELGRGHVFTNLQRWLKQLKENGIILCVCSKNNEDIAKEPFEKHEEMVLRLSDISLFVANWEDKASNIKMIQESLNIGMDSIVFIDDNTFERNLVREMVPEITVPELPDNPEHYLEYLQSLNLFDTVSYTGETADRTAQYKAEFERRKSEATFDSIDEYLMSLDMVGEAKPFEENRYSRIAQLTQRSNQFNLRTVRYTEDEVRKVAEDDRCLTIYYTLRDKFGDHGLVGVVIGKRLDEKTLFIDTWLMSCRVLKRGMEEYIVNRIVDKANDNGYTVIEAEYIPTRKNSMVKDIYTKMGFEQVSENYYRLNVGDYKYKNIYITEEE